MRFTTYSDMGNIKIHNDTMSVFFSNGYGDGENEVHVYRKKPRRTAIWPKGEFLGHFTVKTKAWLSEYDCDDSKARAFEKGRWFVHLIKPGKFHIEKVDEDIHA